MVPAGGSQKYRHQAEHKLAAVGSVQPKGSSEERVSRRLRWPNPGWGRSPMRPPGGGGALKEGRTSGQRGNGRQ